MRFIESNTQIACFEFFSLAYPELRPVFFAVPNGGSRNKMEAARMKREGVTAGVADALLLKASGPYNGLAIEFKTQTGHQTPSQKDFEKAVTKQGYLYKVVRSFDDFKTLLDYYFSLK